MSIINIFESREKTTCKKKQAAAKAKKEAAKEAKAEGISSSVMQAGLEGRCWSLEFA